MTDETPTPEPTTTAEDVQAHMPYRRDPAEKAEDVEAHGAKINHGAEDVEGHSAQTPISPADDVEAHMPLKHGAPADEADDAEV
jgi:hypothetical protein